jgi:acyl-CoA thioesterase
MDSGINELKRAEYIVRHLMYDKDAFSRWMGISIDVIRMGFCTLRMSIKEEMLNGFRISHGGIAYALADSALAFAANTYGLHAVTVETSISHVKPVRQEDVLTAEARELSRKSRFGIYEVIVRNQNNDIVAIVKGTMFIKDTIWDIPEGAL